MTLAATTHMTPCKRCRRLFLVSEMAPVRTFHPTKIRGHYCPDCQAVFARLWPSTPGAMRRKRA